ncbi:acyltransferase family protein [Phocaeicola coprocola]|jgi:surface polysaccharide O-acyltransferase-like enzyme|uniref:Acyltransferase 3 domain-containing protein n=1 Tax=Phocaeicola coprocola TaxID=310298 RepID=A0A412GZ18_9BACT|nr:acyltransferase family protein [Phocaeicola coprocola]RGS00238.1 hypothetical protein DWY20_00975 [Phocaeicola coprocola]
MDTRKSNIELLRIIAMFGIVISHFFFVDFAKIPHVDNSGIYEFIKVLYSFVNVHVNIFILISGYFSIKLKWKSILDLSIKCLTISLLIYLGVILNRHPFNLKEFIHCFLFFIRDEKWWFIECYFYLMLLSPLLNYIRNNINKSQYIKFIVILAFINIILGGLLQSKLNNTGFTVHHFIFLYFIGGYIRRFGLLQNIENTKLLIGFICLSFTHYLLNRFQCALWRGYIDPIIIINAIFIFIIFSRIEIQNKYINILSKGVFTVYLIHDDGVYTRGFFREIIVSFTNLTTNLNLLFLITLAFSIVLFISILVGDILLRKAESPLINYLSKYDVINKLNNYINKKYGT